MAPLLPLASDSERLLLAVLDRPVEADGWTAEDWERLVALAGPHGLAPALHACAKERALAPPSAAAARLRHAYLASAARSIRQFEDLGAILRALNAASIPVVVLKGAAIAEAVYGNIATRPMLDLDLLVSPEHLMRALEAARALGFESRQRFDPAVERAAYRHMPALYNADGTRLELHWTIGSSSFHERFTRDDLDGLWARAVPATVAGEPALVFAPADLLLHLCVHASILHRFDGPSLRAFVDLARVIRRYGETLDWARFVERANRWGAANGVRLALRLTGEWTGAAVPASAMQGLQADAPDGTVVNWARHKIAHGAALTLNTRVPSLEAAPHLSGKLRVLRDVLFPERAEMARVFGVPTGSWRVLIYYPVRLGRLWKGYGKAMWRLARRDETLAAEARAEARLRQYLGSL